MWETDSRTSLSQVKGDGVTVLPGRGHVHPIPATGQLTNESPALSAGILSRV